MAEEFLLINGRRDHPIGLDETFSTRPAWSRRRHELARSCVPALGNRFHLEPFRPAPCNSGPPGCPASCARDDFGLNASGHAPLATETYLERMESFLEGQACASSNRCSSPLRTFVCPLNNLSRGSPASKSQACGPSRGIGIRRPASSCLIAGVEQPLQQVWHFSRLPPPLAGPLDLDRSWAVDWVTLAPRKSTNDQNSRYTCPDGSCVWRPVMLAVASDCPAAFTPVRPAADLDASSLANQIRLSSEGILQPPASCPERTSQPLQQTPPIGHQSHHSRMKRREGRSENLPRRRRRNTLARPGDELWGASSQDLEGTGTIQFPHRQLRAEALRASPTQGEHAERHSARCATVSGRAPGAGRSASSSFEITQKTRLRPPFRQLARHAERAKPSGWRSPAAAPVIASRLATFQ